MAETNRLPLKSCLKAYVATFINGFNFADEATEAVNNKEMRALRGATPAQAINDEEPPTAAIHPDRRGI